ncbi:hypothetical protein BLX41_07175 [Pseudomonas protegens]|nr:hypothetical protein BLX41_07175 [Pseudomonas protegens]
MGFQCVLKMQSTPFHCVKDQYSGSTSGRSGDSFHDGVWIVAVDLLNVSTKPGYALGEIITRDHIRCAPETLKTILVDEQNKIF